VQDFLPVVTLVGFALLLWLLLVRPQPSQRELARMQSTLEVGDEVMLTSGVFGTVRASTRRGAGRDRRRRDHQGRRGAVGQVVRRRHGRRRDTEVSEEN
jgi:preprotein translocase subunit YajC